MKLRHLSTLAFSTALLSGPLLAQQEDPFEYIEPQVRVQVEYIEVSHETLTDLMFGEKMTADDTALRKELAQLVKKGTAKIVETQLCTTRDEEKATTESIEEYIYPTEYDPAEIPLPVQAEGQNPNVDASKLEAIGPNPTAFETRYLGPMLEIETRLGNENKTVDLKIVSEIVEHTGNTVWLDWKGKYSQSPVQMPNMYTVRLNTRMTLVCGKPMLAAVLTPRDKNGMRDPSRKFMVFVKCDTITLGK